MAQHAEKEEDRLGPLPSIGGRNLLWQRWRGMHQRGRRQAERRRIPEGKMRRRGRARSHHRREFHRVKAGEGQRLDRVKRLKQAGRRLGLHTEYNVSVPVNFDYDILRTVSVYQHCFSEQLLTARPTNEHKETLFCRFLSHSRSLGGMFSSVDDVSPQSRESFKKPWSNLFDVWILDTILQILFHQEALNKLPRWWMISADNLAYPLPLKSLGGIACD